MRLRSAKILPDKKTLWSRAVSLGIAAILLAAHAFGQDATAESGTPDLITSISQFWNLTPEERTRPHPFRIECDITFFDPVWRNLWIQDSMQGAYVSVGNRNRQLPIESGQHVILT